MSLGYKLKKVFIEQPTKLLKKYRLMTIFYCFIFTLYIYQNSPALDYGIYQNSYVSYILVK